MMDDDAFWGDQMASREKQRPRVRRGRPQSGGQVGVLSQIIEEWLTKESRTQHLGQMDFQQFANYLSAHILMNQAEAERHRKSEAQREAERLGRRVDKLIREKDALRKQLRKVVSGVKVLADELYPPDSGLLAHHPHVQIAKHLRSLLPPEEV